MNLKATHRNTLVYIEKDNKEKYKFKSGVELFIVKGHSYNLREDNPSIGKIIDGEGLTKDSICLLHHNASHETYHIEGVEYDNGQIIKNLYSVPLDMIFCFKEDENKNWVANKGFLITLRLYKPYVGLIEGVPHNQIKHRLFVVNGNVEGAEVEGKVVIVSAYSDYEIIFREDNVEKSVIRTREREILGIDVEATKKVFNGEYLLGNNLEDAKKYEPKSYPEFMEDLKEVTQSAGDYKIKKYK